MSDKAIKNHQLNDANLTEEEYFFDQTIRCVDCKKDFIWAIGEQIFFRDKGLSNPPKRCRNCKTAKNKRITDITAAHKAGFRQRIEIAVYCAKCESYTTVPFYPSQDRPVLCRSCFLEKGMRDEGFSEG